MPKHYLWKMMKGMCPRMLMDFLKGLMKSGQDEPESDAENVAKTPSTKSENEPWPGFPLWPNSENTTSPTAQKNEVKSKGFLFNRRTPVKKPQMPLQGGIPQRRRTASPNSQINPVVPGRGSQTSRLNSYQNPYFNPYQSPYQNPRGQSDNPFATQMPMNRPMERPMLPPPFAAPRMQRFNGRQALTQMQTQAQRQSHMFGYPTQSRMQNRFTYPGIPNRPPMRQFQGPWL